MLGPTRASPSCLFQSTWTADSALRCLPLTTSVLGGPSSHGTLKAPSPWRVSNLHQGRSHAGQLRAVRGSRAISAADGMQSTAQGALPGTVGRGTLPRTWSNPDGDVLTEVVPGRVWAACRPFMWNGIDVGGRMAVVLLDDGTVWVHSPVGLDAALKGALREIGEVKHVVSPNTEHCKYAQQWIEAYPGAKSYACPGLQEQRPNIKYSETVGEGHVAPAEWKGEFNITFIDCERNPFTGKPFFNEVIFCHEASKTLFVTDFFWNYPESDLPLGSAAWKFGMDRVYHPFYQSFMVTDKERLRHHVDRMLSYDWDILVPCHGSVVRDNAKRVFERSVLV